ncbi:MAG: UDP-N-acetylmuramate--L-alanine ligase, partial [Bacilli bacterium]
MNASEHVHFIGIGGYGMSGIARVMLEMGFRVSGSDMASREITDKLQQSGAKVFIGHKASNITGADMIVYSSAIPQDNVELLAASEIGTLLLHRSDMLAKLLNEKTGIAISGAHGKTTTSSMISLVMERCGLDPTYLIGGEMMNMGSNAKAGNGDYVVAEADESDRSFLKYQPAIAVVTNIEADHLENYEGSFEHLKDAYQQFLNSIKVGGTAVICQDDEYLRLLSKTITSKKITFGIDQDADYRATNVCLLNRGVTFDVEHNHSTIGHVRLRVPGKHNVYNALATIVVCHHVGLSVEEIADVLKDFYGAKRRFQVLGEKDGMMVIDDYAHHPTEIQATIAAAK